VIQKLVFDGVGFASKFLSSLVPWPLAMVPRSRRKILSSLLVKIPTFDPPFGIYTNNLKVNREDISYEDTIDDNDRFFLTPV